MKKLKTDGEIYLEEKRRTYNDDHDDEYLTLGDLVIGGLAVGAVVLISKIFDK